MNSLLFSNVMQSTTSFEFNQKTRDLEKRGVQMYAFGYDVLMEGSAGLEGEELQRYLHDEGFYTSNYGFTGYFGPVTKTALLRWQVQSVSISRNEGEAI